MHQKGIHQSGFTGCVWSGHSQQWVSLSGEAKIQQLSVQWAPQHVFGLGWNPEVVGSNPS